MDEVASAILENDLEKEMEDVPNALRFGAALWPLDRYLRERLRERIGRNKKAPLSVQEKAFEKLQALFTVSDTMAPQGMKSDFRRNAIVMAFEGKADRLIYRKGKRNETL